MIDHEGLLWSMYDGLQLSVKNGLLPQKLQRRGLVFKGKMGYYGAFMMGYYGAY